MDYIDRTVLRLKRQYSKDELVAHLTKKLKETEIELGKTKSEVEELKYKTHKKSLLNGGEQWFKKYNILKMKYNNLVKEIEEDKAYSNLKKENAVLYKRVKNLSK